MDELEEITKQLIAYWHGDKLLDLSRYDTCRKLADIIRIHLPDDLSLALSKRPEDHISEIQNILANLEQNDIVAKQLILSLSIPKKSSTKQEVHLIGNSNEVLMAGRDILPRRKLINGKSPTTSSNDSVFIVHGRDDSLKETVARFLEKLGLGVIILHEQPNESLSIIEKLEKYSLSAKYAIVLLTPDDVGALALNPPNLSPRARQNVIFEMGYFYGTLGRKNVCALFRGIEVPSDIRGISYISVDDRGAWKLGLLKELKVAGLNAEWDRAF